MYHFIVELSWKSLPFQILQDRNLPVRISALYRLLHLNSVWPYLTRTLLFGCLAVQPEVEIHIHLQVSFVQRQNLAVPLFQARGCIVQYLNSIVPEDNLHKHHFDLKAFGLA